MKEKSIEEAIEHIRRQATVLSLLTFITMHPNMEEVIQRILHKIEECCGNVLVDIHLEAKPNGHALIIEVEDKKEKLQQLYDDFLKRLRYVKLDGNKIKICPDT